MVERVKKKSKKQKRKGTPFKKSSKLNPIKSLQQKSHQGLGKLNKKGIGSHSANREWGKLVKIPIMTKWTTDVP